MTRSDLIARLEAEGSRERFAAKYIPEPNSGCWLWDACILPMKGGTERGGFYLNGRTELAHRASYILPRGPIPAGLFVCHRCDNPICVNPDHLFLGSQSDNMRDMVSKGRHFSQRHPEIAERIGFERGSNNTHTRGEGNPKAKLTIAQVMAIRADARPTKAVAAEYGVNRTTIQRIRGGKQWAI